MSFIGGNGLNPSYEKELRSLGSAINETEIPLKLSDAELIEGSIPRAVRELADISLFSYDYLPKNPGKRLRLVPRYTLGPEQYLDRQDIIEVVIVVSEQHIQLYQDGTEIIQVSTFELILADGTVRRFVVTNTDIQEIQNQEDVDLEFNEMTMTTAAGTSDYSVVKMQVLNSEIIDMPQEHIAKARLIYSLFVGNKKYKLGNQSYNDGTMGDVPA